MKRCSVILLFLSVSGFLTVLPAQGEWYVIGQTGVVLPGSLSNVTLSSPTLAGGVNQARVADIDLEKGSPLYGAKVGYFFAKREWFGIETEAFTTQLNIKQQTVVGGVPGNPWLWNSNRTAQSDRRCSSQLMVELMQVWGSIS